ncbi:MAG: ribonucleoprotein [Desulfurococcales archaeon]|jgi:small nuclear ribonucleoprotein|nr:ribonucleoprotein [Desulfurococcales archaeon]MCC6061761.1 ribonucleoprotein [Desulfurococcales archaeon]
MTTQSIKPESPMKILRIALSKTVMVKLKDGTELVGLMDSVDSTMNVVLREAVQIDENERLVAKYGKILIRGSQILYIATNYGETKVLNLR